MTHASVEAIRVVLAGTDAAVCSQMTALLNGLGHIVLGCATSGTEAVARARALRPDAVLLDVRLLDGPDGVSAEDVADVAPGSAVVLFCGGGDVRRLSDREVGATAAFAYLPNPVPTGVLDSTLRLAVARVQSLASARREAEEAKRQLENRKLIERAKGVLMRRTGSSEQDAYSILRRQSQDRSVPMVEIARAVLESEPGYGVH